MSLNKNPLLVLPNVIYEILLKTLKKWKILLILLLSTKRYFQSMQTIILWPFNVKFRLSIQNLIIYIGNTTLYVHTYMYMYMHTYMYISSLLCANLHHIQCVPIIWYCKVKYTIEVGYHNTFGYRKSKHLRLLICMLRAYFTLHQSAFGHHYVLVNTFWP